jgi:hypothetical protein
MLGYLLHVAVLSDTRSSCCEQNCEKLQHELAKHFSNPPQCRVGCQHREGGVDVLKTGIRTTAALQTATLQNCNDYCSVSAVKFWSQPECEVDCRAHNPTSAASCVSYCTHELLRQRAAFERNCNHGCSYFDDCSCKAGSYTRGVGCDPCPAGHYCEPPFVLTTPCPAGRFGLVEGLFEAGCSGACEEGFYCPAGSVSTTEFACPAGRYGARQGLESVEDCAECEPGHFCPDGSTSPYEIACPAGRYGATRGLADEACTSECPAGSYCPEASDAPIDCPAGRYGAHAGESNPSCTGDCDPSHMCPSGSVSPTEIHCPGFGGDHSGETMHQCLADGDGELGHQRDYLPMDDDVNVAHYYPAREHYVHSSHDAWNEH